ncbi:MAG: hypothetical protein M1818_002826 [Claussenomyces sp. TS43310]|nr:MAG: hypothetical protein M1818_002826 [Claussenomyces sp. TS43310]
MWFSRRPTYSAVDEHESKLLGAEDTESESSQSPELYPLHPDRLPPRYRRQMIWMTVLNVIGLVMSTTLFVSWYSNRATGRNALLKQTSFYSPVLEQMDLPTSIKEVNGTLWPGKDPSFARQFPNPEADAIWEEMELLRTVRITEEEVLKLGKDPATVAKFDDDFWGFGDNAYMAQIDVFHQLHCLNQLRKLIYPEYYGFEPGKLTHASLWFVHLNHCVDILAQNLMCDANVDLYTLQWMETQGHPFPDFNLNHQCRDFDALVDWRKENGVDIDMWVAMEKPQGATQVPAPPEMVAMYDLERQERIQDMEKEKNPAV